MASYFGAVTPEEYRRPSLFGGATPEEIQAQLVEQRRAELMRLLQSPEGPGTYYALSALGKLSVRGGKGFEQHPAVQRAREMADIEREVARRLEGKPVNLNNTYRTLATVALERNRVDLALRAELLRRRHEMDEELFKLQMAQGTATSRQAPKATAPSEHRVQAFADLIVPPLVRAKTIAPDTAKRIRPVIGNTAAAIESALLQAGMDPESAQRTTLERMQHRLIIDPKSGEVTVAQSGFDLAVAARRGLIDWKEMSRRYMNGGFPDFEDTVDKLNRGYTFEQIFGRAFPPDVYATDVPERKAEPRKIFGLSPRSRTAAEEEDETDTVGGTGLEPGFTPRFDPERAMRTPPISPVREAEPEPRLQPTTPGGVEPVGGLEMPVPPAGVETPFQRKLYFQKNYRGLVDRIDSVEQFRALQRLWGNVLTPDQQRRVEKRLREKPLQ